MDHEKLDRLIEAVDEQMIAQSDFMREFTQTKRRQTRLNQELQCVLSRIEEFTV